MAVLDAFYCVTPGLILLEIVQLLEIAFVAHENLVTSSISLAMLPTVMARKPVITSVATVCCQVLIDLLRWEMVVHDAVLVGLSVLEHIHHVSSFTQNVLQDFNLPMLRRLLVLTVVQFLSFLETQFHPKFSAIVDWSFW